jgi:hypothetical protein
MDVYIYNAALLCEQCGAAACAERDEKGAPDTGDSDDYPQGPYPGGGGEADSPQHCDACLQFLENPLTGDGYAYVREAVETALSQDRHGSVAVMVWAPFYGIEQDADEPDRYINGDAHCAHEWSYDGTAYGGDNPAYHGEGRVRCNKCGADGDA